MKSVTGMKGVTAHTNNKLEVPVGAREGDQKKHLFEQSSRR